MSVENFQEIRKQLAAYGQEHILRFWGQLSDLERAALLRQIDEIDFELMSRLIDQVGLT